MALTHFTGFEGFSTAQWTRRGYLASQYTQEQIGTSYGRNGSQGLYAPLDGYPCKIPTRTTNDTIILGCAFRRSSASGTSDDRTFIQFWDSASNLHAELKYKNAGPYLQWYNASGTALGGTWTPISDTWYYLEIQIKIHDTTGTLDMYVDGVSVISASGLDTKNGSEGYVTYVGLGGSGYHIIHFDDLYIADTTGSAPYNTYLGDCRVKTVTPAADDSVQFTPDSGTNVGSINDVVGGGVPDDDATFNWSSTVGHKDLFTSSGYSDPSPAGPILAVNVIAVAGLDSGSRSLAAIAKKGSSAQQTGTALALTTSYAEASLLLTQDPETAAAWADAAAINALKMGYEVTA